MCAFKSTTAYGSFVVVWCDRAPPPPFKCRVPLTTKPNTHTPIVSRLSVVTKKEEEKGDLKAVHYTHLGLPAKKEK